MGTPEGRITSFWTTGNQWVQVSSVTFDSRGFPTSGRQNWIFLFTGTRRQKKGEDPTVSCVRLATPLPGRRRFGLPTPHLTRPSGTTVEVRQSKVSEVVPYRGPTLSQKTLPDYPSGMFRTREGSAEQSVLRVCGVSRSINP